MDTSGRVICFHVLISDRVVTQIAKDDIIHSEIWMSGQSEMQKKTCTVKGFVLLTNNSIWHLIVMTTNSSKNHWH